MTTKSPANAAHDAARAEDEQRARAELHEYITSLERQLRTRAEVADHARATLNERLAAAEKQLAEVTRERDAARLAIRTIRDAMNCAPGEDPAECAERLVSERGEALRDLRNADAAFAACARAAECVYEDGTLHDVRTTVAHIEQLAACAGSRCTCAQLAAEDEAEAERDRVAIAESERDEARQQRDEVTRERDKARAAIQEAEERGMVRGLEHGLALLWSPEAESAREYAARICAEARAKGGE